MIPPVRSLCLLAALLVATIAKAQAPVPPEAEAVAAVAAGILAPEVAAWDITADRHGVPGLVEREVEGQPALAGRRRSGTVTSSSPLGPGQAVVMQFFLRPEAAKGVQVRISPGLESADAKEGAALAIGYRLGESRVSISLARPELPPARWMFSLDGLGQRSLGWPEAFRKQIEAYQANMPTIEGTLWELRMELHEAAARVYLNGRLLGEVAVEPQLLTGHVRVLLSEAVLMTQLAAEPLEQVPAGYELLPLEKDVNAAEIDGKRLAAEALGTEPGPLVVDGVPFRRPRANAAGDDHIDIGASWVPSALLEGHMPTRNQNLTGRWPGALFEIPMRLQLRIPTGRYRAVHLLAAADGEADSVPLVTAQFYRPLRGFPENFVTPDPVPPFSSQAGEGITVATADGGQGRLYRITIPVDPGRLAAIDGVDELELELTKQVRQYRAYPDPSYYSWHGAGLPSSVRVFAVTLERPPVEMTLTPDEFADSFVAPQQPTYSVELRNTTNAPRPVTLTTVTTSWYDQQETRQEQQLNLPANDVQQVRITLSPPSYGYHDLRVTLTDGEQQWNEQRGLAWLRQDTRERGDWEHGRGPNFGFWNWNGGHETPPGVQQIIFMGKAGAETASGSLEQQSPNITDEHREAARTYKISTFKAFGGGDHYITARFANNLKKDGLESARTTFLEELAKAKTKASDVNRPIFLSFFPEPHIGKISYGTPPQYYNEEPWELEPADEEKFQHFLAGLVEGAKILKEHYPDVKVLFPHGDPTFPVLFAQRSAEARDAMDGIAVDIPVFERMPEQQLHQVSLHRMYIARDGLTKAGVTDPLLPMYEGPSRSAYAAALSDRELADFSVRDSLLLYVYGVDIQTGGWAPFEAASFWGEQHYGGGISHRHPRSTPRPAYTAYATMTRHLNRRNFTRWLPTGTLSLYALEFTHYRSGEKMHAFWTLRGERPVRIAVPVGQVVRAFDLMDNEIELQVVDGAVTIPVTTSPCWVYGLSGDETLVLGDADHGDAAPGEHAVRIATLGDGRWRQSDERDEDYETSHDVFVRRYPGRFTSSESTAPAEVGGRALAVTLAAEQEHVQQTMPYYTTYVPPAPIEITGKGSHLGLWVRGTSDFGRVVYALRDSKGERWLSVGTKGAWNCDDIFNWSVFCFDGWRYLTFEMPASSGWDTYREAGTVWWGSYGAGDGIVDLPLRLEKIIVERRTHAMYVNDPQPAPGGDVLFGDLYVEYATAEESTSEAVRQAQLRMPVPTDIPELGNPIAEMAATGVGDPLEITRITLPDQQADGTRCMVHFTTREDAESYEVWASPYEDGRGALALGTKWQTDGQLIRGLRPETDFWLFVISRDGEGQPSKPSKPFHIKLEDRFAMK